MGIKSYVATKVIGNVGLIKPLLIAIGLLIVLLGVQTVRLYIAHADVKVAVADLDVAKKDVTTAQGNAAASQESATAWEAAAKDFKKRLADEQAEQRRIAQENSDAVAKSAQRERLLREELDRRKRGTQDARKKPECLKFLEMPICPELQ